MGQWDGRGLGRPLGVNGNVFYAIIGEKADCQEHFVPGWATDWKHARRAGAGRVKVWPIALAALEILFNLNTRETELLQQYRLQSFCVCLDQEMSDEL